MLPGARFFIKVLSMMENVKIYTSDKYWSRILTDLGASVVDSCELADIDFDKIDFDNSITIDELKKVIFDSLENRDIITSVFGKYIVLPNLQHKIIVALYKNHDISIRKLKEIVGVLPDVTSHTVENAIYQLRKIYGHDLIQNVNGKYKIGHI